MPCLSHGRLPERTGCAVLGPALHARIVIAQELEVRHSQHLASWPRVPRAGEGRRRLRRGQGHPASSRPGHRPTHHWCRSPARFAPLRRRSEPESPPVPSASSSGWAWTAMSVSTGSAISLSVRVRPDVADGAVSASVAEARMRRRRIPGWPTDAYPGRSRPTRSIPSARPARRTPARPRWRRSDRRSASTYSALGVERDPVKRSRKERASSSVSGEASCG